MGSREGAAAPSSRSVSAENAAMDLEDDIVGRAE
jgi:hypothetical protein